MKKQLKVLFGFFFMALMSCTPKAVVPQKTVVLETINNGGKEILINEVDKAILQTEPYKSWFEKNYNSYQPKEDVINQLKKSINKYDIEMFFGSWCGDSKRGVPRVYKVLDEAEYDLNRLKTIAVGRKGSLYKKSTNGATDDKNIKRVPTIIVYNTDGEELGRIIENPTLTFEEDLLNIIKQ